VTILVARGLIALAAAFAVHFVRLRRGATAGEQMSGCERDSWRMPRLDSLLPRRFTPANRLWMLVLRAYPSVTGGLVLTWIVQLTTSYR
jgi:hypothetical protein